MKRKRLQQWQDVMGELGLNLEIDMEDVRESGMSAEEFIVENHTGDDALWPKFTKTSAIKSTLDVKFTLSIQIAEYVDVSYLIIRETDGVRQDCRTISDAIKFTDIGDAVQLIKRFRTCQFYI